MTKRRALPWFKFYPDDWLAGVSSLTPAERGVLMTLIALMFDASGPLVPDKPRLARQCGTSVGAFSKILQRLVESNKIEVASDGLLNRRALREIEDRQKERFAHVRGAKETNDKRWKKSQKKQSEHDHSASRSAQRNPETTNQIPSSTKIHDEHDTAKHWLGMHRDGKSLNVVANLISPLVAQAMLHTGEITKEEMKQIGITF